VRPQEGRGARSKGGAGYFLGVFAARFFALFAAALFEVLAAGLRVVFAADRGAFLTLDLAGAFRGLGAGFLTVRGLDWRARVTSSGMGDVAVGMATGAQSISASGETRPQLRHT